jgi:hypothetical protein
VRAKQSGGRAAAGRIRPRVRPGHDAGKEMTGGSHLSSAAARGSGEAGWRRRFGPAGPR